MRRCVWSRNIKNRCSIYIYIYIYIYICNISSLRIKEEISETLHFEHSFLWYLNWGTSKSGLGIPWSFEVWCWRRLKKIIWTNRVKSRRYYRQSKSKEIYYTTEKRTQNGIGHTMRMNCFLMHITEGKTKGKTEKKKRRWRRCQQLLDDLKEKRGYWKYIEEVPALNLWRTPFGKVYGRVLRWTTWWWWWWRSWSW